MAAPLDQSSPPPRVSVVAFDVGETVVDESRIWSRWAERLGVPPFTFFAVIGAIAATGRPHREIFETFRPGFDLHAELAAWAAADPGGLRENFDGDDLYPDVLACFDDLTARGVTVVIAGNQPPQAASALGAMDLGVDIMLMSDDVSVAKPDPAFFAAVADAAGVPPGEIAYVGDRVDNDVLPAKTAGMTAVLLRRGPWGHLHSAWPQAAQADHVVDTLSELPDLLAPARQ